ncbi:hypothetical protein [Flavobacterium sp. 7A]|uniref:hypothetical protein n=1 Tax=Flavobacterium sp. 7A TaxID=2940571 RepID=UPI002227A2D2|nr:hypothetical protein [Flavobacterium sp. 7A]MCW2120472.1 hypothetical protein [Flavobacterium sp. 7A]
MKKTLLLVVILISLFSCVSDHLEGTKLIFSEETIVFNGSETKSLFISTNPKSDCDYQITSMPSWVQADHKSGNINTSNGFSEVILSSDVTNLQPGKYEGKLEFTTTLGNKTILLQAIVGDNISYSIPKTLSFSINNSEVKFSIKNNGNIPLLYSFDNRDVIAILSSNAGTIEVGGQKEIVVTLNRGVLPNGSTNFNLNLKINNNEEAIAVDVNNFKELKSILIGDVMDAEYSKVKDQLVFVSANPSKLSIYNPITLNMETIPLVYTPTCVSLSQDGETAVVGHDGHITYVNLKTKAIIKTYSSSCFAIDIVLGNNKWAYVFPKENQWTNIRCINMNLSNDNEALSTGGSIYAGTKGRLHSSGKYIYGADNGVSPSDIEKYDIQNGVANMLYDSPYHGDYPMSGNLWFTEDGVRIFTRGKTVLRTSDVRSSDMVYNGSIAADSNIEWLDHSAAKENLFVIINLGSAWLPVKSPYIYNYNATNLNLKNKIELEKYQVPNNFGGFNYFDAEPYFVFSNSTGNAIYIMTKARGAGLVNEWAIQKIAVN